MRRLGQLAVRYGLRLLGVVIFIAVLWVVDLAAVARTMAQADAPSLVAAVALNPV